MGQLDGRSRSRTREGGARRQPLRLAALCASVTGLLALSTTGLAFDHPFQNPDLAPEERITDLIGRMTLAEKLERPLKQLRGFARISLRAGESRTVVLKVTAADLAYWDVGRRAWVVEDGRVELMVGPSSADADLKLRRTIVVNR
jgi:hypothetical protein